MLWWDENCRFASETSELTSSFTGNCQYHGRHKCPALFSHFWCMLISFNYIVPGRSANSVVYIAISVSVCVSVCPLAYLNMWWPLPLTHPRDVVPRAHPAVHRCRRSVWYNWWPMTVTSLPHWPSNDSGYITQLKEQKSNCDITCQHIDYVAKCC